MTTFHEIFKQQKRYNDKIRSADDRPVDEWTETYLLGLISEIDDILDSLNWKRHRQNEPPVVDVYNLGNDLADLTKYILSLWELWEYSADDVLQFVQTKSEILEELYRQEFDEIPTDRLVVITDLDGTLGDWRKTFIQWAYTMHGITPNEDGSTTLQIDSDLAMRYDEYYKLKEDFESTGQYKNILLYSDAREFLRWLKEEFNAYIIAHTARPWQQYYRIWGDTWNWICENGLPVDQLRIGSESRILLASSIGGENVLMLEDDPGLMLRAAHSEIRVIAREHPYNNGVTHEYIQTVRDFSQAKESIRNDFRIFRKERNTGKTLFKD